jgi:hypothetical protein
VPLLLETRMQVEIQPRLGACTRYAARAHLPDSVTLPKSYVITTIIAKTHVFNKKTKKASAAEMQGYVFWSLTSPSPVVVSLENQLAAAMAERFITFVAVILAILVELTCRNVMQHVLDPNYHSQPPLSTTADWSLLQHDCFIVWALLSGHANRLIGRYQRLRLFWSLPDDYISSMNLPNLHD